MKYIATIMLILALMFSFTFKDISPNLDALASVLKIYTDADSWVELPTVTAVAAGDMLYRNDTGAGAFGIISKGNDNEIFTMNGNYPNWETSTAGDVTSGSNITEHSVVRGADGAKGVELSTVFITDAGEMYNASQPSFLAHVTSTQVNRATNVLYTIPFGTEDFDLGNDYDHTTYTFTAPVTGRYLFTFSLYLTGIDNGADYYEFILSAAAISYTKIFDFGGLGSDPAYWSDSFSITIPLSASDTAHVTFQQAGGTAQTDIVGFGLCPHTTFSGALLH